MDLQLAGKTALALAMNGAVPLARCITGEVIHVDGAARRAAL